MCVLSFWTFESDADLQDNALVCCQCGSLVWDVMTSLKHVYTDCTKLSGILGFLRPICELPAVASLS